jgi:hypothetical protein
MHPVTDTEQVLNVKLINGEQQNWIQVRKTDAIRQILQFVNDVLYTKVNLKLRGLDVWKAELTITGKGLGGTDIMVKVTLIVYHQGPDKAIISRTSSPATIQSYIEIYCQQSVPEESIPFHGEKVFATGELLVISGQEEWKVESATRRYLIRATWNDKKEQVLAQVGQIWRVMQHNQYQVQNVISRDWKEGRIVLPELTLIRRSWTREILGLEHLGVLRWAEEVKGAAKLDQEKLAILRGVRDDEVIFRLDAEWSRSRIVMQREVRFHAILRANKTLLDWEQLVQDLDQGILKPIEVWNGHKHKLLRTVSATKEQTAKELTEQLWHIVEPDQIQTRGKGCGTEYGSRASHCKSPNHGGGQLKRSSEKDAGGDQN